MEEAVRKGVRNLSYVKAILENWKVNGFKAEKPKCFIEKTKGSGFNNFEGRNYSEDYYKKLEEKLVYGRMND